MFATNTVAPPFIFLGVCETVSNTVQEYDDTQCVVSETSGETGVDDLDCVYRFDDNDTEIQECIDSIYSGKKPPDKCKKYEELYDKYEQMKEHWLFDVSRVFKFEIVKIIDYAIYVSFVNICVYMVMFMYVYDWLFKSCLRIRKSQVDYSNVFSVTIVEVRVFMIIVIVIALLIHLVEMYWCNSWVFVLVSTIELIFEIVVTLKYYPFMHNLYIKEEKVLEDKLKLSLFEMIKNWYYRIRGQNVNVVNDIILNDNPVLYVKARPCMSVADVEDNNVFGRMLTRIFDSNENTRQLRVDIENIVFGSIYEYAERFVQWNRNVGNNRLFTSRDRHVQFNEMNINGNINRSFKIIANRSVTNERFIFHTALIIYYVADYIVNNRLHGMIECQEVEGEVLKRMRMQYEVKADKKKVCMDGHVYNKTLFEVCEGKVNLEIVSLEGGKEQVQAYSTSLSRLNVKAKKINGTIELSCDDYQLLYNQLIEIESGLKFKQNSKLLPHSHSHYKSKVMHIRQINRMITVGSEDKILDVGSSLSDPVLGYGVEYNVANVEEQDSDRIDKTLKRMIEYLKYDATSIVLYVGDVTQFDFSETRVKQVLLHNCCYNIDLVKMLVMLEKSGIEMMVNSTQIPLNIIKGFDCDNLHNEMQWSVKCGENESTLTRSKVKIVGMTDVSYYEHDLAVTSDWFTKCSVVINYQDCVRYWNQNTIDAFHGYYVHGWRRSKIKKESGILRDNDVYLDLMYINKDLKNYNITYATRCKTVSVYDLTFHHDMRDRTRTVRERQISAHLANLVTPETEITTVQNTEWSALYWYGRRMDQLIYRLVDVHIDQRPAEVKLNVQYQVIKPERKVYCTYVEDDMDLEVIIRSLMMQDYNQFEQSVRNEGKKGNIVFLIGDEYYILSVERRVSNKMRVIDCNSDVYKIVDYEEEHQIKVLSIERMFNFVLLTMMTNGIEKDGRYDRKRVFEVVDMIKNRRLCDVKQLELLEEIEKELSVDMNQQIEYDRYIQYNRIEMENYGNRRNQGNRRGNQVNQIRLNRPANLNHNLIEKKRNVKLKQYAIEGWMNDMTQDEVDSAVKTGKAFVNHVNCCCVLNLDDCSYYDPFVMLNVNQNQIQVNANIRLQQPIDIYQNNINRQNVIQVQDLVNNGIYCVICEGKKFVFRMMNLVENLNYQRNLNINNYLRGIEM